MKNIKVFSEGNNYTSIDLGELDHLGEYSFLHPKLKQEIIGKVFLGEVLNSTGVEISLQILPPNTNISFLHKHRNHEEIYFFIKGSGQFQVDDSVFNVGEGTLIRISPEGIRTWRNNSDKPLIYMVIQSQSGTLDGYSVSDGFRVAGNIL